MAKGECSNWKEDSEQMLTTDGLSLKRYSIWIVDTQCPHVGTTSWEITQGLHDSDKMIYPLGLEVRQGVRGEWLENTVNEPSPERAHQFHGVRENFLDKKQDKDNSCLHSFLFAD